MGGVRLALFRRPGGQFLTEQVGEEGAVVDEGLAEVLRAGLAPAVAQVDLVGVPVVAQGAGVLDGQVRDLVGEVTRGVAPFGDQPGDQFVGLSDGLGGESTKRT